MKISKHGIDLLIQREGFMLKPYRDSKGLLTIGVGHLLTKTERMTGRILISGEKVAWKTGLTSGQVRILFDQDLDKFEDAVNRYIAIPLMQHEFDALVSFCFNIGRNAFRFSTLRKKLNHQDRMGAINEFTRWRKPASIISRRAGEQAQFMGHLFVARQKRGFVYV